MPEGAGIWIAGGQTSEIILYTGTQIEALAIRLRSPVANTVGIAVGGPTQTIHLRSNTPVTLRMEPRGVHARGAWAYLLSVSARSGIVPRLISPQTRDARYLGVQVSLTATERSDD